MIVSCTGEGSVNISNCPIKRSCSDLKKSTIYLIAKTELLYLFQHGFFTRYVVTIWALWTCSISGAGIRLLPSSMEEQWFLHRRAKPTGCSWKMHERWSEQWRMMKGLAIFCWEPSFAIKICATYFELLLPGSSRQSLQWGHQLAEEQIIPKCRAVEISAPSPGTVGGRKAWCRQSPGSRMMWCWLVCTPAA